MAFFFFIQEGFHAEIRGLTRGSDIATCSLTPLLIRLLSNIPDFHFWNCQSNRLFGRRIPLYISSRLYWLVYQQLSFHHCRMYTDTTSSPSQRLSRSSSSLRKRFTKAHLYYSFAEAQ
jgi:hypothetical protein